MKQTPYRQSKKTMYDKFMEIVNKILKETGIIDQESNITVEGIKNVMSIIENQKNQQESQITEEQELADLNNDEYGDDLETLMNLSPEKAYEELTSYLPESFKLKC